MKEAAKLQINVDGHVKTMWAYILKGEEEYDLILGRLWMNKNEVTIAPAKRSMYIYSSKIRVRSREGWWLKFRIKSISATTFKAIWGKAEVNLDVQIFAASMADIEKALKKKVLTDP
jgi:hypothetical protein